MKNIQKKIKQFLNEALGVPDGVILLGEKLYKESYEMVNYWQTLKNITKEKGITGNFTIGDYNFQRIRLAIELKAVQFIDENQKIGLLGLSFEPNIALKNKGGKFTIDSVDNGEVVIKIKYGYQYEDGFDHEVLLKDMRNRKSEIIGGFTHELMHSYDAFKKSSRSVASRVDYATNLKQIVDLDALKELFHLMYYTHDIENAVRSSQLAAEIYDEKVTQAQFKDFLVKNEIFVTLKKAKEYTYEGFINSIKDDIVKVRTIIGTEENSNTPDEVTVRSFLNAVWGELGYNKGMFLNAFLNMDGQLVFDNDKKAFISKTMSDFAKFGTGEAFFRNEIKQMNQVAGKMIKKIAGLYALIPHLDKMRTGANEITDQDVIDNLKAFIDGDMIEIAYAVGEGQEVNMEGFVQKYYGDALRRNKLSVDRAGLELYIQKKKIGLI